ncbi:aspartate/glutamate racemase family protein [Pinisolibacter aquiterrae]|uniref:aspartate/glutamate racemase family protein n=1 Tax=Pinisolibacter aquiterrae TaxID=2815579 RepID=UPI001C3DB67B|nr:aspartate/glutamate racemase family protein [Pinisolibacter aquiterrae]MBV5263300.1 aspartate/glutamate racemase family protein [Pinisolibacter aquiterrae]MCC8237622.1 aspartate/glutamate racemase family protein [Pinisolibacter aquiterrae]
MLIHLVNPNTTRSMTEKAALAARAVAAPGTEIRADESRDGPASIEGPYDGALAVPGLLARIEAAIAAGAEAHVIACFDDTGLDAARALSPHPVIGIGEAACHTASLVADRFTVVTTLSRSVPTLRANIARYGLAGRCAAVRAAEVPVLALEEPGSDACRRISAEIARALAEDGSEAIVLGCAGMTDLARALSREHGVPVIDGVTAAVVMAEGLVRQGLATSKRGGWASPAPKAWIGRRLDQARVEA